MECPPRRLATIVTDDLRNAFVALPQHLRAAALRIVERLDGSYDMRCSTRRRSPGPSAARYTGRCWSWKRSSSAPIARPGEAPARSHQPRTARLTAPDLRRRKGGVPLV